MQEVSWKRFTAACICATIVILNKTLGWGFSSEELIYITSIFSVFIIGQTYTDSKKK